MKAFCLEKWYFDVLTRDGRYVFGYLARLRFLGCRQAQVHLHIAGPGADDRVSATHKIVLAETEESPADRPLTIDCGAARFTPVESSVALAAGPLAVDLRYETEPDSVSVFEPLVIKGAASGQILWQPVMLSAQVRGRVRIGRREESFDAEQGYVDYLRSEVLPWNAPVATLYWGRMLHPSCDLTYTHALGQGRCWSRLCARIHGRPLVLDNLLLETGCRRPVGSLGLNPPETCRFRHDAPDCRVDVRVEHRRLAAEQAFAGPAEPNPNLPGRLLRRLTRDPMGVKFLSRAAILIEQPGARIDLPDVPGVAEYARFTGNKE